MSERPGFDFDAAVLAPFRMQPGLRRLGPDSRELTALSPHSTVFQEKLAVLQQDAASALLSTEGFDPLPAWRALAQAATAQCTAAIAVTSEGIEAPSLGWRVCWDGHRVEPRVSTAAVGGAKDPMAGGQTTPHPHDPPDAASEPHAAAGACLRALPPPCRLPGLLSLALYEDFAIVDGADATLPALAVCLPSHWAPEDKIGRSFATVHGPVADNAMLIAASRHLMQLVCQPQRWERFVWNLTPANTHDLHPRRHPPRPWPTGTEAMVAAACWRTERQTFIPLPERRQAVFTIHVDVQPLAQTIDSPQRAAALHAALASMSDAVLDYRGLTPARDALLDWLAGRAGAALGGHDARSGGHP